MNRSLPTQPKARAFQPGTAVRHAVAPPRSAPAAPLVSGAWSRLGLRTMAALASGIMVFAVAGLLGGLLAQGFAVHARVQAGETLQADAMRIADQVNQRMSARARELFLLGSLNPIYSLHDGRQVQSLLTELRSNVAAYYWLGVTDAAGHMVASTNPELLGGDFSGRPEIREGLRGFSTGSEGAGGQGPDSPEPLPMTLTYPVRGVDGGVAGVVVAQLHWSWIRDLANAVLNEGNDSHARPDTGTGADRGFVLINNQDRVLLGPRDLVGSTLTLASVARARSGYMGWSAETWPDHKSYLTGAAIVQQKGAASGPGSVPMQWTVLTREDASVAFEPTRVLRAQVALGGVVLALIAAALGWFGAGLVTKPLRRMVDAVERAAQGETGAGAVPPVPAIERPREVARLADALRTLLAEGGPPRAAAVPERPESVTWHDPLTGLLNREGLKAWLIERMRPDGLPRGSLMVFLADLDGFMTVNERFGEPTGDAALAEVAARMQRLMRPNDAVARFGGDEFLIILDAPKGSGDEAAEIAIFDLFDAVNEAPYELADGLAVSLGISLGGALWPEDDTLIDRVIAKADAALYAAKRAGKGRIIMHQPDPARSDPSGPLSARG